MNAFAGISIGDNCIIEKNVNINTYSSTNGYSPIVIGSGNILTTDINPGAILPNISETNGLSDFDGELLFVVSTGRSGSASISTLLSKHPDVKCSHEAFPHLHKWSCDLLSNTKTPDEMRYWLKALYNSITINDCKVYGQSDQKLVPFIQALSEIFPNSKFIWLTRNAVDFINSSYPRGWFDNTEFGYPINQNEYFTKNYQPSEFYSRFRFNGSLAGVVSEQVWKDMTAFERNCLYWSYWNKLIEDQLNNIEGSRWIKLKIEDLNGSENEVFDFLNLTSYASIKAQKTNVAKQKKISFSDWNESMISIYLKHCDYMMHRLNYD